jgi:peptidyl-prolyl cis-trans isomerase D
MISWMQKNNKYLVITIWVATIAFIGAGAVGWGSANLSSKSASIAKVGDIEISKMKYSFTYSNLYNEYAERFGSKFDKKTAKELGLEKAAYNSLITQALLLNLAKEYGITASDLEVAKEIAKYSFFKKGGSFNKEYYDNFLKSRGMKAADFEAIVKDDLIIRKLMKLLDIKPLDFEKEAISLTFKIADKIKYSVITPNDVNVSVDDKEIKQYWEKNKLNYLTPKKYELALLWTKPKNITVSEEDLKKYFEQNRFNFTDDNGKQKEFKDVKEDVKKAYILEKLKKQAAIDRSRFKKGKIKASEVVVLAQNEGNFTKEIWNAIKNAKEGDFIKPKAVETSYVTINLKKIIKPQTMSFEEAKELAKKDLMASKKAKELENRAKELLKSGKNFKYESKDYLTLSKLNTLEGLTPQESMQLVRAIFASTKKRDSIKIGNSMVVYEIIEQKLLDSANLLTLDKDIKNIKSKELTDNLISNLQKRYKIESYVKDFQ